MNHRWNMFIFQNTRCFGCATKSSSVNRSHRIAMRIIKPKFSVHVTRLSYSLVLAKNKKMCKKTQEDEANSTTTKQIALPLLAKQQLFASKKKEREEIAHAVAKSFVDGIFMKYQIYACNGAKVIKSTMELLVCLSCLRLWNRSVQHYYNLGASQKKPYSDEPFMRSFSLFCLSLQSYLNKLGFLHP